MRERLLGYLFDQLDDEERRAVEKAIAEDPRLQRELDCLRKCLDDGGDCDAQTFDTDASRIEAGDHAASEFERARDEASNQLTDRDETSRAEGLAARSCQHVAVTTWTAGSLCRRMSRPKSVVAEQA